MYFARSEYLNLLWGAAALGLALVWSLRHRNRRLARFVAGPLASALANDHSRAKAKVRALLLLLFFVFGVLALGRPQWGTRIETVRRKGVDIFIALDTSYSMDAEDVAPSRFAQARSEARSLISRLRGDRVGLITFAGNAFVLCPLTLDYGAASLFLDAANTGSVPEPGTSLASAIRTANSAFVAKERKFKVLVLITDGEDLDGQLEDAVAQANDAGIVVYSIGIGTPEGRPIPVRDEKGDIVEYRKDPSGQVVVSSLDERSLAGIATQTGGRYFRATTSESELDEIYDEVSQLDKKEFEARLVQNLEDRFQYPLGAAILCLVAEGLLSERRRPRRPWLGRFLAR